MKKAYAAVAALWCVAMSSAVSAQELDVAFPNGDQFVGSLNGAGVYSYASGSFYEGEVASGTPSGQGRLILSWGDRYEGAFIDGAANGEGVYVFADGVQFAGTFTDWVPNGDGALILADSTRFEGAWSAGIAVDVARVSGSGELPGGALCTFNTC